MTGQEAVQVRLAADGQLEMLEPSIRSGSMRATSRGLCPSGDHIFGLASKDSRRLVATVAGTAAAVVVEMSDGTSRQPRLRRIEGTDAQYFVVSLAPEARPGIGVATSADGEVLAAFDFSRRLV